MGPLDTAGRRAELRAEMRARRAGLDEDDQAAASMAVLARIARLAVVRGARVVSGYRAVRGELDVDAVLFLLAEKGITVTTPRVRGEHLEFVVTSENTPVATGPFGISEPAGGEIVAVTSHDVMLIPLVAFDANGRRLGQGGGYYDRALGPVRGLQLGDRPALVGVAHSFQQVVEVPSESWDVPLDAVVTEEGVVDVTGGVADRA